MSLAITISTPQGLVLAADSRQSFRNQKNSYRIGSDSAEKILRINARVGLVVTGLAFLPASGVQKNIAQVINDFILSEETRVKNGGPVEVAKLLRNYLHRSDWFQNEWKKLNSGITTELEAKGHRDISIRPHEHELGVLIFTALDKNGSRIEGRAQFEGIQTVVSGFDEKGSFHVLTSSLPGPLEYSRNFADNPANAFGASWIGQTDVLTRFILGFDHRIFSVVPFVKDKVAKEGLGNVNQELKRLEYSIQWGSMNLQDGIDLASLLIETTTAVQRFSDGILADPGDIPGVGGPIDVAIITRESGFKWIARKALTVGTSRVLLDEESRDSNLHATSEGNSRITTVQAPMDVRTAYIQKEFET